MMSLCTKCERPCLDLMCASCEEALELGDGGVEDGGVEDGGVDFDGQVCYNDRLSAGFALIMADENPGNYNDHWS